MDEMTQCPKCGDYHPNCDAAGYCPAEELWTYEDAIEAGHACIDHDTCTCRNLPHRQREGYDPS